MNKALIFLVIAITGSSLISQDAVRIAAIIKANAAIIKVSEEVAVAGRHSPKLAESIRDHLGEQTAARWIIARSEALGLGSIEEQMALLAILEEHELMQSLTAQEAERALRLLAIECELLYARKQFQDVLRQSDTILRLAPDRQEGLIWRGQGLGRLGLHDQAIDAFDTAVRLYPHSVRALTAAAYYYFFWSDGRTLKTLAWPLISRALSEDPNDEMALRLAAEYSVDGGECIQGLQYARRSVELHYEHSDPWRVLGDAHLCLGDKTSSEQSYARAAALASGQSAMHGRNTGAP